MRGVGVVWMHHCVITNQFRDCGADDNNSLICLMQAKVFDVLMDSEMS